MTLKKPYQKPDWDLKALKKRATKFQRIFQKAEMLSLSTNQFPFQALNKRAQIEN